MADSFQSYKVAANEQSSSTKFNNFVQALEDAINSLDNSNIATSAAILVSKLASGSNGDFLQTSSGIPVWGPGPSVASYQTTLPGSPVNGQETILVDSTTSPTYAWRFRYNSAKSSNKWDFIGGSAKYVNVETSQTTASTSDTDLGTDGPTFTLPVAGDYEIGTTATLYNSVSGSFAGYHLFLNGSLVTDSGAASRSPAANATTIAPAANFQKITAVGAHIVKMRYSVTDGGSGSGTGTFVNRRMTIRPIAVGG